MSNELIVLWSLFALYALWVLIPLVPAVLIYKMFPSTVVAVSGPFAGLTVKAGGAFGAYLIVFAALYLPLQRTEVTVASLHKPVWTFKGQIKLVDKDGNPVSSGRTFQHITVTSNPQPFAIEGEHIRMKIVEDGGDFPILTIQVPSFGGKTIALRLNDSNLKIDRQNKTIELSAPIEIREWPSVGLGFSPPAANPAR